MSGRSPRAAVAALLLAVAVPAAADLRREVEPNDTPTGAQPVIPPASLGGAIAAPGDVDVFAVRLEADQVVKADVLARGFRAGSSPGSELSALLQVLAPDGVTVLAQDESMGDFDDPTVNFVAPSAGRYLVSVRDLSPMDGSPAHHYVLSVEVDFNDAFADATPLQPPVLPSIDTLIYPAGDRDVYRVEGAAGQVLTVDIDSAVFNPSNPPAKVVLTLFDDAHTVIAQDAYTSSDPEDPRVQVALPADGAYFVEVRELRAFVGNTNTFYQMAVELGPSAANDTFSDGMPVSLPRAVSGVVSPASDLDHFRFDLAAPASLRADVDAREDLLSLLDGLLALNDGDGVLVADAAPPDPSLVSALASGPYSISLEGPCVGGGCENEDSYYVIFLDADLDGDGEVLPHDNCPMTANPDQADADVDGVGDPCDNCPAAFNPDQADADAEGTGDACAPCGVPEVATDLAFLDAETLAWTGTGGGLLYDLYRGTFGAPGWVFDHACLQPGLTSPGAVDPEAPTAGGLYYLVGGRAGCGGPLGLTSGGAPRPNAAPCP